MTVKKRMSLNNPHNSLLQRSPKKSSAALLITNLVATFCRGRGDDVVWLLSAYIVASYAVLMLNLSRVIKNA